MSTMSYPAFRELGRLRESFSAVAAVRADTIALGRGADAEDIAAVEASGEYFTALGVQPLRGRFFSSADDALPAGSPVAVLSYAFWTRHFAGDAGVINHEIVLDDRTFTIIGVAPKGFTGHATAGVDVFVPLTTMLQKNGTDWIGNAGMNLVAVVARLRDGTSAPAAQTPALAAFRAASPDSRREYVAVDFVSLVPGRAARDTAQGRTTVWLSGVALVVLLVATANVGTLLLLRALRRRREIAVRVALGVRHGRLVRQLLSESLLLACMGGAAGLFVARWLSSVIRGVLLPGLAVPDDFASGRVLAATAAAAILVGVIAGCVPLFQLARRDIITELKDAVGSAARQHATLQRSLVIAQVALCTVLVVGAGLFTRSLQRVKAQDLGFSASHLLFVTLNVRANVGGPERDVIHMDAVRRLSGLPGITAATVVQATPFGSFNVPPISVPGMDKPPSVGGQLPMLYAATPEYLRMMDVKLRDGRLLTDADRRDAPLVVLVNETFARKVWPGERAVGKCIRLGFDPTQEPSPMAPASLPCREVVGVVRDSRVRSLIPERNEAALMQYYVPFAQVAGVVPRPNAAQVFGMVVSTAGDPERLAGRVRRLAQETGSTPVSARVRPYQDLLDPQLRTWRLGATLFSAFSTLALVIAAAGLFGVISYIVAQRTREIGVRFALGGTAAHVTRLIIGDSVGMVGGGIVAGMVVALIAAPAVASMLFQTSARDPAIVLLAAGTLLLVALIAAALPAWRATRVSPLIALRAD
jgi:predicted permease